jgi:hypothetical protein
MNNRLEYGGFIILALPYRLGDDNHWTLNIQIELHTGDCVVSSALPSTPPQWCGCHVGNATDPASIGRQRSSRNTMRMSGCQISCI